MTLMPIAAVLLLQAAPPVRVPNPNGGDACGLS